MHETGNATCYRYSEETHPTLDGSDEFTNGWVFARDQRYQRVRRYIKDKVAVL